MITPLRGLVRCGHCDGVMTPTYSKKGKIRYAYYVCQKDSKRAVNVCSLRRIPGGDIEKAVIQQLSTVFRTPSLMAKTFAKASELEKAERDKFTTERDAVEKELGKLQEEIVGFQGFDSPEKSEKLESAKSLATRLNEINKQLAKLSKKSIQEQDIAGALAGIEELWNMLFPAEQYRLMQLLVDSEDASSIILKTDETPSLISELSAMNVSDRQSINQSHSVTTGVLPEVLSEGKVLLRVPTYFKDKNGQKKIITPETLEGENPGSPSKIQNPLVQAISNANKWKAILGSGEVGSVTELAINLGYSWPYVARILSLTPPTPDIVHAIINGEEPNGLSLDKLVSGFPADWQEQKQFFGFKKQEVSYA